VRVTDTRGVITEINDNFCAISGYDRVELIGRNHRVINSDYHEKIFFSKMWKQISQGHIWGAEICNQTKGGNYYWVDSTIVPYLNKAGKPYQYVSVRTDITKTKEAEFEAQQKVIDYRLQQDFLIGLLSKKSLFLDDIDSSLATLFKEASSNIGVSGASLWSKTDNPTVRSIKQYDSNTDTFGISSLYSHAFANEIDSHALINIPDILQSKYVAVLASYNGIKSRAYLGAPVIVGGVVTATLVLEHGSPRIWNSADQQFVLVMACITALIIEADIRRASATRYQKSEKRLTLSQNFGKIGTWEWNIKTGSLYWSERIAPLFGYIHSIPETTYENFLAAIHPDDRESVEAAIFNCVNEDVAYSIQHRVVWEDGSVHWLHESGDVIRNKDGESIKMLGVVRDVTESHEYEASLRKARDEAEKANLAKSEFLSRMSHELRTPLNAILGFSQLLEMDSIDTYSDGQTSYLGEIISAGNHLLMLINQVLDLAKIEARHVDIKMEPMYLKAIFEDCVSAISTMMQRRDIGTVRDWEDVCDVSVIADRTRVKQVLLNLLSNAAKYSDQGGIVNIGFGIMPDSRVRCYVKDEGPGISDSKKPLLFQAFNRLGAENTHTDGAGIGLAISKGIVEQMRGSMGVESSQLNGSKFWFDLILNPVQGQVTQKEENNIAPVLSSLYGDYVNTHKTILYVEDNPTNMLLVEKILSKFPFLELFKAFSPKVGLDLADENNFDIILLDINFPEMDGFDILEILRERQKTKLTPIIAVTANAMQHDIDRVNASSFDEIVAKPFKVDVFMKTIFSFLS